MTIDLQPLCKWLIDHPEPDEQVATVRGGDAGVDEDRQVVTTMSWMEYMPVIPAFWSALAAAGWTIEDTSDYHDVLDRWQARHRAVATDPEQFGRLDRHTLANALRWHDRGERFCNGHWESAYRRGVMHAGARAVLELGGLSGEAGS